MNENDLKLTIALIAAGFSLLAALLTAMIGFYSTRKNQRDLELLKDKNQRDLEDIRDRIDQRKSERDALRDYEYEARKRLYFECAPLFFQLSELSEGALNRIKSLARTAAMGKLGQVSDNWLNRGYYKSSTFYKLMAPLAVVKLIQHRLTLIDFSLDRHVYAQYSLAKQLYQSFSDDFYFAKAKDPVLLYDPHCKDEDVETKRSEQPEIYWQQGIPVGILDNAIEALIVSDAQGILRLKTFAEFETEYKDEEIETNITKTFSRIDYVLTGFHPKTRPVLWRMLVTQAHLYNALLRTSDRQKANPEIKELLRAFPMSARTRFDWRRPESVDSDSLVIEEPFEVAESYLKEHLKFLLEP